MRRPSLLERVFPKTFAHVRESTRDMVVKAFEAFGWGPSFTGEKWPGGLDFNSPKSIDHWALRQNGRTVALESPEARTLLNRSTDLVMGTGATLNLEPKYELLGITAETAEAWARDVEMLFDLWASSPAQHKSGHMCFYEAMRSLFRGHKRDNEFFVRLYYNQSDPSLILPLQFEIIDPNQVRGDAYTSLSGFNMTSMDGIERDANGYETTYKVWIQSPGTIQYQAVDIPRIGPKSGRLYMIHGYTVEFAGQGRGFSEFGLDIQNYKSITDFKLASLEKAKKQSNILLSFESDSDHPTMIPSGFDQGGVGPNRIPVPGTDSETPSTGDTPVDPSYHRVRGPQLPPGSFAIVDQPGKQKVKPFESTSPVVGQAEYIKGELQPLFATQGMSVELAYMDLKSNYNANQLMLLLNDLNNDVELFLMAVHCFDPILEMFMSCAIAAGRVSAPGWQDPILHAAYMAHRWSRPPMPNIDRVKSATADKLEIQLGETDLEALAMKHNGSSYRSNVSKLKRQYTELTEPPWGWGPGAAAAPQKQDDKGDEPDENQDNGGKE